MHNHTTIIPMRHMGRSRGADGRFTRVPDRVHVHADYPDFRELCRRAIRPDTRYLVLDLDGTFHRGLNLGVFLGWELSAYEAYGLDYLRRVEGRRGKKMPVLKPGDPVAQLKYTLGGARRWALPGLSYNLQAKKAWHRPAARQALVKKYGLDAIHRILALPRIVMFHHMSRIPQEHVRELARSLWRRYADRQVIFPEDVAWVREQWPEMKIIVSSASPRASLDVVAEMFDVDDVVASEITEHDGYTDAPPVLHRLVAREKPARFARPGDFVQNAHRAKIARLVEQYPDFLDSGVHTVGMTDTNHGEDYVWAEYMKCVVDVNGPDPFPPFVSPESPLEELHSARVLTGAERRRRDEGEEDHVARSRKSPPGPRRVFVADEIRRLCEKELLAVEQEAARVHALLPGMEEALAEVAEKRREVVDLLSRAVDRYNTGDRTARAAAWLDMRRCKDMLDDLRARAAHIQEPAAGAWTRIMLAGERARQRLETAVYQPRTEPEPRAAAARKAAVQEP
ncbi:MAG: hypothetical protein ACLFOY_13980 [Desulfatibacillaceae bacterium]